MNVTIRLTAPFRSRSLLRIPIPNPNHFSTLGTTGGPVSALNPNMLANSDSMTSAFPAEYGNAVSGVFDLRLRTGNRDRCEFMGLAHTIVYWFVMRAILIGLRRRLSRLEQTRAAYRFSTRRTRRGGYGGTRYG